MCVLVSIPQHSHLRPISHSVKVTLSNARGACLLPATNHNADSIASSALTKFVSGMAKSHMDHLKKWIPTIMIPGYMAMVTTSLKIPGKILTDWAQISYWRYAALVVIPSTVLPGTPYRSPERKRKRRRTKSKNNNSKLLQNERCTTVTTRGHCLGPGTIQHSCRANVTAMVTYGTCTERSDQAQLICLITTENCQQVQNDSYNNHSIRDLSATPCR